MIVLNKNNCHNCEYMKANEDKTLHCYMFKNEPVGVCAAFKPDKQFNFRSKMSYKRNSPDFVNTLVSLLKGVK